MAAEEFVCKEKEKKAWNKLKEAISEDTMLRYFDLTIPAVIDCDASGNKTWRSFTLGWKTSVFCITHAV